MMYRFIPAAILSIAASFVYGQVEVVDRQIPSQENPPASPSGAGNVAEMYYQLQLLQQEVLLLRGLVEQQAFEIKKLKQQRLDDYLDLDRRVSQLGQSGSLSNVPDNANTTSVPGSANNVTGSKPNEMKNYRAAMNLVLKEQKYDDAIVALKQHLDDYPRGRFSANAQYWLGEVYLQKKEYEEARQWFARVLGDYPNHTKVPDAQYKLGTVYHVLGDNNTAKDLLEKVAQSDANAARLARDYLDKNF